VAFNTTIMPVKVLDRGGAGTDAQIIQGIRFAADNGAEVLNMSLSGPDPNEATRVRVREGTLAAWGAPRRRHSVRWLAAAAAMVVVCLLPLVVHRTVAPSAVNAEAVLLEVDKVLDRDPLSALASEEVVEAVVPVSYESGERSVS
jgi:subtilisin family serine protease